MKKVLVVVDMQNDFIDGTLGTAEAQAIVNNVVQKIQAFDGRIVVTHDTHQESYLSTQEGKLLPVEHCIDGTDGWKLNDRVFFAINEKFEAGETEVEVFFKPTFGSVEMAEWLRTIHEEEHIDEIELIGLCTDICVISNALLLKAFFPEVKISVDASCCAGVTPESHANALNAMKMCQIFITNEVEQK